MESPSIPRSVAAQLGFYVYLYVDPRDDRVFYVGKGKGARAVAHIGDENKVAVQEVLSELRSLGLHPRIEILAHGLRDAATALRIEAAAIDLLGVGRLTNLVRGHFAKFGRMPLEEVVALYVRRPAKVIEPAILIRINQLYRYGMTAAELYDATRSAWVVGPRRNRVELAFAVFEGVVREVYRVEAWHPAGSTFNARTNGRRVGRTGRWEFVGVIAEDPIRERYVSRYVGHVFPQGAQNPVAYINVQ
jgi:hypothetical protein